MPTCFLKQQIYNLGIYKRHISGADKRVFGSGFKQPRPDAFKRPGVFQSVKTEMDFPVRKFFAHRNEFFFLQNVTDRKDNLIHNQEQVFKQAFEDCFSFKFEKGFFDHAQSAAFPACQDDRASKIPFLPFKFRFFIHSTASKILNHYFFLIQACSLSCTQNSSFSVNSFFQIGTSAFTLSIASLRAGKSSVLWADAITM
ncbi:hypothetical protein SDC9_168408 [bioreactor metagenome]|uniref:Uncharacterized protein n=1 Tax=bioreactor metagenome TaxID=1076179 RepID=A0A645G5F3_9ZZZZ